MTNQSHIGMYRTIAWQTTMQQSTLCLNVVVFPFFCAKKNLFCRICFCFLLFHEWPFWHKGPDFLSVFTTPGKYYMQLKYLKYKIVVKFCSMVGKLHFFWVSNMLILWEDWQLNPHWDFFSNIFFPFIKISIFFQVSL